MSEPTTPMTDDEIEQFIYERCRRFITPDTIPAIRELMALSLPEPEGAEAVAWRYKDSRGHWRYRGYKPNFDVEYSTLKPERLFAHPLRESGDAERLDWLERQAKASRTGASFDWAKYAEDGYVQEKGYRFMRFHHIGERRATLREAIDHARKVLGND